jgi:uncharacterized membrane protein YcaP (DUF421 family)
MDPNDLLQTALRATLIYFFLLLVIRLSGKRSVGGASAFDFLVALMLGEVVDEIIYGDVSIVKGLLAITVIAVWHYVNAWSSYKSKKIDELTAGKPAPMIKSGEIVHENLAKERLNEEELYSEMRQQGIADIKEVKVAHLEPSGKVSFLKEDWAESLQKRDLPQGKP